MSKILFYILNEKKYELKIKIIDSILENKTKNIVVVSNNLNLFNLLSKKRNDVSYSTFITFLKNEKNNLKNFYVFDDCYQFNKIVKKYTGVVFVPIDKVSDIIEIFIYINKNTDKSLPENNIEFSKKYIKPKFLKTAFYGYVLPSSTFLLKITGLMIAIKYIYDVIKKQYEIEQQTYYVPDIFKDSLKKLFTLNNLAQPYVISTGLAVAGKSYFELLTIQLIILIAIMIIILKEISPKGDFTKLDTNIIKNDTKKYIKVIDKIPEYKINYKKSQYTFHQISLFVKLLYSNANIENLKDITRINGNKFLSNLSSAEYIISSLKIGNIVKDDQFPEKFEMIYRHIIKHKQQKNILVYSSYNVGDIKKYLAKKEIKHKIYFVSKDNNIPKIIFSEVHILEPFFDTNLKNKLLCEIKKDEHFEVYQWYCSATSIANKIFKFFYKFQNKFEIGYGNIDVVNVTNERVTVDEIIIANEMKMINILSKL